MVRATAKHRNRKKILNLNQTVFPKGKIYVSTILLKRMKKTAKRFCMTFNDLNKDYGIHTDHGIRFHAVHRVGQRLEEGVGRLLLGF